jgi:hypothetical protein
MNRRLHPMFHVAALWAVRQSATLRVVSANDHVHTSPRSKHFSDQALDFWSSDLPGLSQWLKHHGYLVLFNIKNHYYHVHAETTG